MDTKLIHDLRDEAMQRAFEQNRSMDDAMDIFAGYIIAECLKMTSIHPSRQDPHYVAGVVSVREAIKDHFKFYA